MHLFLFRYLCMCSIVAWRGVSVHKRNLRRQSAFQIKGHKAIFAVQRELKAILLLFKQDFCNDLAATLPNDRRLCCDAKQFKTLKKEMASAEAIGMKRCPGCHNAFKNLMCQMTCSPNQASFIVVNATRVRQSQTDKVV